MKLLFLLSILSLGINISGFSQKNCPKDCSRHCLFFFTKYDVNGRDWRKTLKEKNKEIYNDLEKLLMEEDYFGMPRYGVGCFFFYAVFAELAASASIEEDPEFLKFLESKSINIREFQEKGLKAISYAWEVWGHLGDLDHSCKREFEKIDYKEFRDRLNKDSLYILENLWAPKLRIKNFQVDSSNYFAGDLVTFTLTIENTGKVDFMKTAEIKLAPSETKPEHTFLKNIGKLKRDSILVISFEHVYNKPGIYSALVLIDFEKAGIGNLMTNDFSKIEVEVKPKENGIIDSIPNEGSYGLYIIVDSNLGKKGISNNMVKKDYGDENCIYYKNQFPKNIVNTSFSKEQDIRFFKETLRPKLQKKNISLQSAKITITGFADGQPFLGKCLALPKEMKGFKKERFLFLQPNGQSEEETMYPFDSICNNKQLAFVRAYHAKFSLTENLGIPAERVALQVLESKEVADELRGALIEICGSDLDKDVLKEIEDEFGFSQESGEIGKVEPNKELKTLKKEELRKNQAIVLENLYFPADSSQIEMSRHGETLQVLLGFLNRTPGVTIEIGGHTNTNCNEPFCTELSEKRAKAIYNYLLENRIPEERLKYKGYGKSKPVSKIQVRNQRVEIKILEIRE